MASKEQIREWFGEHAESVLRLAWRICKDRHVAEDVLQDTFVQALRSPEPENLNSIKYWLLRIAANRSLDILRSARRRGQPDQLDEARIADMRPPADRLDLNEQFRRARSLLMEKDPEAWALFVLTEADGLSVVDAAALFEITRDAANAKIRRARVFLKERLDD